MTNDLVFNNVDINQKYDTPYGAVYFNNAAKYNLMRLSGGFDSAVMLYVLAHTLNQSRPDAVIETFTVQRTNPPGIPKWERVYIVPYAQRIIEYVRERFPTIDIKDTIEEPANYWWVHEFVDGRNISSYGNAQNNVAGYMRWQHRKRLDKAVDQNERYYIEYNGVTRNPPLHCVEQSDEQHRDNLDSRTLFPNSATVCHNSTNDWLYQYQPWRNADKRIVFWLADQFGILDDMISITRSCEGDQWNTNGFTQECGECWWCLERAWAAQEYKNTEIKHESQ